MTVEQQPEDLLKMMEEQRLIRDKLSILYPALLKKKATKIEARDLAESGLDYGVWPWLEKREANIQLRAYPARDWMNEQDAQGKRRGYKTQKRGRLPFHECTQLELEFDIWEKAKATTADRDGLRSDITNYKFAFGKTPTGPEGQKLPAWIWSDEDDKMFALIEGRKPGAALNRG